MSTTTPAAPAAPPPQSSPRGGAGAPRGGGGRGSRQPRGDGQNRPRGQDGQRPRRGGRGGGRQGQGRGGAQAEGAKSAERPAALKPAPVPAETAAVQSGEEEEDGEVCFICASPVVHYALAPCNHRTCHICTLRLRALYKTRACAHCRSESPFVIFTDQAERRYEEFLDADFQRVDESLGIKYEKQEIFDDTILVLRYNCPDQDCDIACYGWPDLHRHVRGVHHKVMCDLCTRNKKVFTHEHELYTQTELRRHERSGDDNPGAIDQTGFKGHPECGFCRQRFYGDDELYVHCRERHERCHLCDRRAVRRAQQYYVDYAALEAHFTKDHFPCLDTECQERKFVVFDSEMDLKAHQLESHPNGMSKDVRREARIVDMSAFDYRAPVQEDRRRGGRGRGRDPNAEPLPPSSAQPMRRDELAFQRQLAIHSAQSTTSRTFGGQLSSSRPQTQTVTQPATQPAAPSRPAQALATNGTQTAQTTVPARPAPPSDPSATQPFDPRTEARRLQHVAVMDRAAALLGNDPSKTSTFRERVSAYQRSSISASDLIESVFALGDAPASELGTLIKELADIYESADRREGLLRAWQDWRAINEDYPTLPNPVGGSAAAPATGAGGRRVLRLKSASARSGRAVGAQQATWTNLPAFAGGGSGGGGGGGGGGPAFPALSAASARKTPTPWAGAAGGSSSTNASARASPAPGRSAIAPPPRVGPRPGASEAFPELPKAARPNTHMAGLHRGNVLWDQGRNTPKASAWGAGGTESEREEAEGAGQSAGGGKKKKKGKEVLYKFG